MHRILRMVDSGAFGLSRAVLFILLILSEIANIRLLAADTAASTEEASCELVSIRGEKIGHWLLVD